MVLGDTSCATCARISSLLAQRVSLDVRLYYAAVQNLVYGCGNVPQTTAKSSDPPQLHCAQHVQKSIDITIQLPSGLQCDPVQMAELRQQMQDTWDNLSQDDIRHLYDRLHARKYAYVATRGDYTMY